MNFVKNIKAISFLLLTGLLATTASAQQPQTVPALDNQPVVTNPRTGFIPPNMDLSHLTGKSAAFKPSALSADPQFDWRESGYVSSVKNQSTCGSCYAFASLANLESKMLFDGAGTFDFSENNAKECNYFETSCGGGSYQIVANLYAKEGVMLESCDPYVAGDVACDGSCTASKNLLDWRMISGNSVPSTAVLKDYIVTYGPVYTTYYAGDGSDPSWESEMNSYDGSYTMYYTGSYPTNHAVLIVGWDDNLVHAGGTGGWIVKNSWGTNWGGTCGYGTEKGYFTIAYGSANIGQYSSFAYDWQDYDAAGFYLHYDDGGWTNYWGYGSTTGWGMCKFTAPDDIDLTRIEFWTTDATTDIDIYIYDNFVGGTLGGLLASKLNSTFDEAGYHSVVLDAPLQVSNGEDFYVAVKFTNASFTYPIPADGQTPTVTNATYISSNGSSWYDLGTNGTPSDVAIKVRATLALAQSIDDGDNQSQYDFELSQNYPNPFNSVTAIGYSVPRQMYVNIEIFNLLGQKMKTLFEGVQSAGGHSVDWDGTNMDGSEVSTGIYFYRIQADDLVQTKKLVLLK